MSYTTIPFDIPAIIGLAPSVLPVSKPVSIVVDSPDWTIFDSNLRIDEYSNETMHTAVVTYLPTGQQEVCGRYPHMIQNRAAAIAKLKAKIGM